MTTIADRDTPPPGAGLSGENARARLARYGPNGFAAHGPVEVARG
jgi:hypothetical protein